jgi:hypothetical protein
VQPVVLYLVHVYALLDTWQYCRLNWMHLRHLCVIRKSMVSTSHRWRTHNNSSLHNNVSYDGVQTIKAYPFHEQCWYPSQLKCHQYHQELQCLKGWDRLKKCLVLMFNRWRTHNNSILRNSVSYDGVQTLFVIKNQSHNSIKAYPFQ